MFSGITQFCYTRTMPSDAVGIAFVTSPTSTPADLVDFDNTPYLPATLGVWLSTTSTSSPPDFLAPDYNQTLAISGSTLYNLDNQFFDLTNIINNDIVYWYVHVLPEYAMGNASITDTNGNVTTTPFYVVGTSIYHNFYDDPMYVTYTDNNGYVHTDLLTAIQVISKNAYQSSGTTYLLTGRQLSLANAGTYYIRFTQPAGFLAVAPWNDQSNTPWYVRVRYALNPFPIEWAQQNFTPVQPYLQASFVPGVVQAANIVEFERKDMYSPTVLPDILVFNSDYSIKYALDGSPQGSPKKKGNIYPWKRGLIDSIDIHTARAKVSVTLDPTDIVFGFYQYQEPDLIYRAIDVNPFTNPIIKDNFVNLYVKTTGVSGLQQIYYKVVNSAGTTLQTNDTSPGSDSPYVFSVVTTGTAVSTNMAIEDVRVRGGGLTTPNQIAPVSYSCWDTGFWDGKPYPVSGGLLVYLPYSIQNTFDTSTILSLIQETLPLGSYPVIKYYTEDGTESV